MVTAFLHALAEAAEWFRGHLEASAAMAAARTSIEPRYAVQACQALAAEGVLARDLRCSSSAAFAAGIRALASSGLIPPRRAPDQVADAVDYSYL